MDHANFRWDAEKASANWREHGVSFAEAATVCDDPAALLREDEEHSAHEHRYLLLGRSSRLRLLVVVHGFDAEGRIVRIISARMATHREISTYLGTGST